MQALGSVAQAGPFAQRYTFESIGGGTQARVWHGVPVDDSHPEIAVRLTPKPAQLISRIGALVDTIETVECPKTLATGQATAEGRTWTVHVCTWIGQGSATKGQPYALGQHIARLHRQLAAGGEQFADRRLSFEPGPLPPADQELPPWYVARHLWRDRIFTWLASHGGQLRAQPIHGDLHWANVVGCGTGFGFIDFDKLMHAPPVFDLAKLIATGFFHIKDRTVRLRQQATAALLAGYQSVRPLTPAEHAAIEGFAVILNEEIARLGHQFDVASYREQASAVGAWWANRRRRSRRDPLGIRTTTAMPDSSKRAGTDARQLTLFPDTAT